MMITDAFINRSVELFVKNGQLMGITSGQTYTWNELPSRVKLEIRKDLQNNPQALELLQHLNPKERLRVYSTCKFGGFNAIPDIDVDGTIKGEHWNCGCESCPLKGLFRSSLEVNNGTLSGREIEIAKLIAQGYFGKEISARLFISESTINSHKRSIFEKVGVASSVELTIWAHKTNLI